MNDYVDLFCQARQYLLDTLEAKIEVFMTGLWDPLAKFTIIKETNVIIDRELEKMFPDLPKECYPKCRFRIFDDEFQIEAGLQNYLSEDKYLTFLGTNDVNGTVFDYYVRQSWDPRFDYVYVARYGHDEDSVFTGSKTAEAEYYLGTITPLSVAYSLAKDDGFIV
jgi:hypothetical protein